MSQHLPVTTPAISVVITTYNAPEWLRKTLWGYEAQTYKNFEVVLADDGSDERTKKVIEEFRQRGQLDIQHVWHEDEGFRKTIILNKAIPQCKYDYLLFTDGDCVPRKDYLQTHAEQAEPGRFLSGGYCKLPLKLSQNITEADIQSGDALDYNWLLERGMADNHKNKKLRCKAGQGVWRDRLTTTKPTWNGHNASGWKSDIAAANGYDERMQWGGLDRELGERLENAGIRGKQIRHRALCIHLDHGRGYKDPEQIKKNQALRAEVRKQKITRTPHGIEQ